MPRAAAQRVHPSSSGANSVFDQVYYNASHPESYSTLTKLQRATHEKPSVVKNFLKSQDSYTLHFPSRRRYLRNRVVVTTIDEQWGCDLTDFRSIASENNGFSWILCVMDTFSKYAFVQCLKNKSSECVLEGLQAIFARTERRPDQIFCDKGTEFSKYKKFLKSQGILFVTSHNPDIKVSTIERFQLTIKSKLFKAFTHKQSYNYTDGLLDDIVKSYNHTYHRSIKMCPADVTEHKVLQVYRNLYGFPLRLKVVKPKLKVGDTVRITREMEKFEKSVYGTWSNEVYEITETVPHIIPVYRLKALPSNEPVIGTFYAKELQHINPKPTPPPDGETAQAAAARGTTPRHATTRRTAPRRTAPGRAKASRAKPGRAEPRRATPRHATPSRAAPRRAAPRRTAPRRSTRRIQSA